MFSSFGSLNTALKGLQTMQRAIEVNSHNVANAATPGYSRQRAMLQPSDPYAVPTQSRRANPGQVGTGVTINSIHRYRSMFLDEQIRNTKEQVGSWEVRSDILRQIEVAFNEPSELSINQQMSQFWASWQELAAAPNSSATRASVAETASNMSQSIRQVYDQLADLQDELDSRVESQIIEINDLASQIADLNRDIREVQGIGQQPNDLRDQREMRLQKLSQMLNITAKEEDDGSVTISLGGKLLVADHTYAPLGTEPDGNNGAMNRIVWAETGATTYMQNIPLEGGLPPEAADIFGGELGGTLVGRDLILTDVMDELDTLAQTIIGSVNGLHQTGYGLANNPGGTVLASTTVPNTVSGFSTADPYPDALGLSAGDYYVELRDNNGVVEFRMVDSTGSAIAIDDVTQGGTTLTSDWQNYASVAGTNFDTGRGLVVHFDPLADHTLGTINTNVNTAGFQLSGVAAGNTELPDDTYYVEVADNGGSWQFRLVDSSGVSVPVYDQAADDGSLTNGWQDIPSAPHIFDTARGLTVEFTGGPYIPANIAGVPIAAANVVYTARDTQLGTIDSGAASVTMGNFFTGSGAADIDLSNYIKADHNRIATAAGIDSPGDGSIAVQIGQISQAQLLNNNTATIGDYYRGTITTLGQKSQQAETLTTNHSLLVSHLETRQDEIAGVSLDEETVHMLQYQRTYQAAARALTAIDEMLERVINNTGLVGR